MSDLDTIRSAMSDVYDSTEFLVARSDGCFHAKLWYASHWYIYEQLEAALTSDSDISKEVELSKKIIRGGK